MATAFRSVIGNVRGSSDGDDAIVANEEKIKKQKKNVQHLYKQLKSFTESYRKFLASRQAFFSVLDSLFEDNWEGKALFSECFRKLSHASESGAEDLETKPMVQTIEFRDKFGAYEKEMKDYKEKLRLEVEAKKKAETYARKKNANPDEIRRLRNLHHEKKTSLDILARKLREDLPKFYNSRMEFYSSLWQSLFDIQISIADVENRTFTELLSTIYAFDQKRKDGIYDAFDFDVGYDEDDYALDELDSSDKGSYRAETKRSSLTSMESSCYATVMKPDHQQLQQQQHGEEEEGLHFSPPTRLAPPVPTKPKFKNSELQFED